MQIADIIKFLCILDKALRYTLFTCKLENIETKKISSHLNESIINFANPRILKIHVF